MAGDWIKVEHATPDKPEVIGIAERLGIDQDAAFGKLVRIWIWADKQTRDGNAPGVTKTWIDRYTNCAGFADAMADVGWLKIGKGSVVVPNFDTHMSQSAKRRALTSERVKRSRNAPGVTEALPEKRERREEKKDSPSSLDMEGVVGGTVDRPSIAGPFPLPERFDTPAVQEAFARWFAALPADKRPFDPQAAAFAATKLYRAPEDLIEGINWAMASGRPFLSSRTGSAAKTQSTADDLPRMF